MMKRFTFAMRSGVLLAALSMMPACAAEVVDENGEVEVDAEPPPPQVEVVPPVPYPGAVWVGGRWYSARRPSRVGARSLHPPACGLSLRGPPLGASRRSLALHARASLASIVVRS